MTAELVAPKVEVKKKEIDAFSEGLVGLQARFLLGGIAINPENKDVPEVKKEQIAAFETRDYSAFNNTSTYNRHEEWRQKEAKDETKKDFKSQFASWAQDITSVFTVKENQQIISKLKILSNTMGIDLEHFTQDEAAKLYTRYFANEHLTKYETTTPEGKISYLASDVKIFVSDILKAYQDPTNHKLNYEKLKADLPEIQWLANIFGDTASEIVTQLLDAEAKLQIQPDQIVEEANKNNRRNTLVSTEVKLAKYVWDHGQIKPQAATPAETKSTTTTDSKPVTPTGTKPPTPEDAKPTAPTKLPTPPEGEGTEKEKAKTEEKKEEKQPVQRKEEKPVWYYERADQPGKLRFFPERYKADEVGKPEYIAKELKRKYPEKYKNKDEKMFIDEIRKENADISAQLKNSIGFDHDTLNKFINGTVKHYEDFLGKEIGIKIPEIGKIKVVLVGDQTVKLLHPGQGQRAMAFVLPTLPVIFIDVPTLIETVEENHKYQEKYHRDAHESKDNIAKVFLIDVVAHEYDHLLSDLAYWYQTQNTPPTEKEKEEAVNIIGKSGIEVRKPIPPYILKHNSSNIAIFRSRGKILDEAITSKLTHKFFQFEKFIKEGKAPIAYQKEVDVLNALTGLIAKEQSISEDDALKMIVKGQFSPQGFLDLNKALAGRTVDKEGKVDYRRKSFLKKIYTMMSIESKRKNKYSGTLDYINRVQKSGIRNQMALAVYETIIKIADKFLNKMYYFT